MIEELEIHDAEPVPAAVIHLNIPRSEMQKEFPRAIHEILEALRAQGLGPAGPPYARHFRLDPEKFDFEVGFPVEGEVRSHGRMSAGELPASRVVRTIYRGPYEGLPDAWQAFQNRIEERGIQVGAEFRERYVVGPESGPDSSKWRTELSWAVA